MLKAPTRKDFGTYAIDNGSQLGSRGGGFFFGFHRSLAGARRMLVNFMTHHL
jgi:hypothetical protein